MANLNNYSQRIEREIIRAKKLVVAREQGQDIPDFDIRGRLYALALEMCPMARAQDLMVMKEWGIAVAGQVAVDIAAGTGFLTWALVEAGSSKVYAIDPSREQMSAVRRQMPTVTTITGTPDDPEVLRHLPLNKVDLVTSFGGLHHVEDHAALFCNVGEMIHDFAHEETSMRSRFIAADVCDGTPLQKHFDHYVAKKCLTKHTANWLNEERVTELANSVFMEVHQMARVDLQWVFASEWEMGLFFKALHAYDLPWEEVAADLNDALGYERVGEQFYLNWPMLFFAVQPKLQVKRLRNLKRE